MYLKICVRDSLKEGAMVSSEETIRLIAKPPLQENLPFLPLNQRASFAEPHVYHRSHNKESLSQGHQRSDIKHINYLHLSYQDDSPCHTLDDRLNKDSMSQTAAYNLFALHRVRLR